MPELDESFDAAVDAYLDKILSQALNAFVNFFDQRGEKDKYISSISDDGKVSFTAEGDEAFAFFLSGYGMREDELLQESARVEAELQAIFQKPAEEVGLAD